MPPIPPPIMSAKIRFDIEYMVLKAFVGYWILPHLSR
jgi:hypothetical protein